MTRRLSDYTCTECGNVEERYWDIDEAGPECSSCGAQTTRNISCATISYAGEKTFRQRVPDGFKDVLKNLDKSVPAGHKAGKFSAL